MKTAFLLFFFIVVAFSMESFGALPPTTLSGMSDTTKTTTFNFKVPNKQSTKVDGGTLIETGNKNRLENPGFEHLNPEQGWSSINTGSAVATLGIDDTNPIEGKRSLSVVCVGTVGAGTCEFYQDVTTKHRMDGLISMRLKSSSQSGVKFIKRIDGADTSTEIDPSNSQIYKDIVSNPALFKIPGAFGTTSTGLKVKITVPAGQIISVVSDDAFVGYEDIKQDMPIIGQQSTYLSGAAVITSPATVINSDFSSPTYTNSGSGVYSYNPAAGEYTFLKKAQVTFVSGANSSSTSSITVVVRDVNSGANFAVSNTDAATSGAWTTATYTGIVNPGDKLSAVILSGTTAGVKITVSATSIEETSIISTSADYFDTDVNNLTWKATAITDSDPVGTYNTYSYAVSTNTKTICATRPTQTDADMKTNGILIYTRAFNAASTCGNPARVEVKLGKGMATVVPSLYKNTGKSIAGNLDWTISDLTVEVGVRIKEYDGTTGVYSLDAALRGDDVTNAFLGFSDTNYQTSGYLHIFAQKAKSSMVADLKQFDYVHVEASGNSGQSITGTITDIPFIETKDPHNLWDGDSFTPKESGVYTISVAVRFTTVDNRYISLFKDGVIFRYIAFVTAFEGPVGSITVELEAGKTYSIRTGGTAGTLSNNLPFHHLTITRIPGQFR